MDIDLVVIAGIKRSASTAVYNLVRLALKMAGYEVTIFGHSYRPRREPKENEVHLLKRHPFSKRIAEKADHIFLTDRNDKDILKSLDRMWGSGDPDRIEGMRKDLEAWKQYSDIPVFKYEDLENAPVCWVEQIIEALELYGLNPYNILDEFNKIEPPEDKQDPVTLLFPNHIS